MTSHQWYLRVLSSLDRVLFGSTDRSGSKVIFYLMNRLMLRQKFQRMLGVMMDWFVYSCSLDMGQRARLLGRQVRIERQACVDLVG